METDSLQNVEKDRTELRWYRFTPGRLLLLLLLTEGILFFLNWLQWIPKGRAVLIALASLVALAAFLFVWFAVALLFRWRFQFSVRTLLLLTVAVAAAFSWLAIEMEAAKAQKEAVRMIAELGGEVYYDHQASFLDRDDAAGDSGPLSDDVTATFLMPQATPSGPAWMRDWLGVDFVADVVYVKADSMTDDTMKCFRDFPRLHSLILLKPNISDAGLEHLVGLTRLRKLYIEDTEVTATGVEKLRKALPNCEFGY